MVERASPAALNLPRGQSLEMSRQARRARSAAPKQKPQSSDSSESDASAGSEHSEDLPDQSVLLERIDPVLRPLPAPLPEDCVVLRRKLSGF